MSHGPLTRNRTRGHGSVCQMARQNRLVARDIQYQRSTGPCPTRAAHESMGPAGCTIAHVCSHSQAYLRTEMSMTTKLTTNPCSRAQNMRTA
jgi:hypothetical protein